MCGDMLAAFIIIKTVLMHTFIDLFLESAMNMYKKIQITLNMASKGWKKDINVLSHNIMWWCIVTPTPKSSMMVVQGEKGKQGRYINNKKKQFIMV